MDIKITRVLADGDDRFPMYFFDANLITGEVHGGLNEEYTFFRVRRGLGREVPVFIPSSGRLEIEMNSSPEKADRHACSRERALVIARLIPVKRAI